MRDRRKEGKIISLSQFVQMLLETKSWPKLMMWLAQSCASCHFTKCAFILEIPLQCHRHSLFVLFLCVYFHRLPTKSCQLIWIAVRNTANSLCIIYFCPFLLYFLILVLLALSFRLFWFSFYCCYPHFLLMWFKTNRLKIKKYIYIKNLKKLKK